jgi:hypothetical protein
MGTIGVHIVDITVSDTLRWQSCPIWHEENFHAHFCSLGGLSAAHRGHIDTWIDHLKENTPQIQLYRQLNFVTFKLPFTTGFGTNRGRVM